jgi:hypothetical protein
MVKEYFQAHWKWAQVIHILKPGKPLKELTSYRPIRLLPFYLQFLKTPLKILLKMVENNEFIPNHQNGLRKRHPKIEQTHRIVQKIYEALEQEIFFLQHSYTYLKRLTKYGVLDSCTSEDCFSLCLCLGIRVFVEPFPSNGCLYWIHISSDMP